MSYSRSSVQQLLSALAVVDGRLTSLTPNDIACIRGAANAVLRSDEPLTALEAHRRLVQVAKLARDGNRDEARVIADRLHRDALLAVDRLPVGSAEAIELASLALKSIEIV